MQSHIQTRALADALRAVDATLRARGTRLQASSDRDELERLFARDPGSEFFRSWAFDAEDFDAIVATVAAVSPRLATQLERPRHPREFTVISSCVMDLRFAAVTNGARSVAIRVEDGRRLQGAYVKSFESELYESGLVAVPTTRGEKIYFCRPEAPGERSAAELAHEAFASRGSVRSTGLILCFPAARTSRLVDSSWIRDLKSACGEYAVKQFLNEGEAVVDEHGFFARETAVVVETYFSETPPLPKVILDGPFLVFLASESRIQAAAWFDRDSFSPASADLEDADKPEPAWVEIEDLFNQ